jgi:hypothetical protein
MDIIAAKLVTGEEVIAKRSNAAEVMARRSQPDFSKGESHGEYAYEDIRIVRVGRNEVNDTVVVFIPFSMLAPDLIILGRTWDAIAVADLPVTEGLQKLYLQNTSRIALA